MTLYGIDIAKYQGGLNLAQVKREGFAWVEARASTGYQNEPVDPAFAGFKAAAAKVGLPLIGYHFLYSNRVVPIAKQAAQCAAAIGDTSVPVMIDHETADNTGVPSAAEAVAFAEAMRSHGYRVPLWYLPHWVWQRLGSPALPVNTGMGLVASSYVNGSGYASALYPGDSAWPGGYGGLEPVIWQFTDKALVAGQHIDADAFKGSQAELLGLFGRDWMDMATQADLQAAIVAALQSPAGQAAITKAVVGDHIPNHFGGEPTVGSILAWIDDHVAQVLAELKPAAPAAADPTKGGK